MVSRKSRSVALLIWAGPLLWFASLACADVTNAVAQQSACPATATSAPTPAEAAYAAGRYPQAEDLYGQELAKHPQDLALSAGLVKAWLHQGEVAQAAAQVERIQAVNPDSAITLTSLAEVQLHEGQPWLALETLKRAEKADPCYARIHFVRSRVLRIDSMYASERAEVQAAYDIDPSDPDIRHAWLSTVTPAHEIESIDTSLRTMKDLDAESKKRANDSLHSMMRLLSENNQTCEVLPTVESVTLPMQPSYVDAKHVDGYKLDVQFPKSKARLQVDTAASGMFISRALADLNGFEYAAGAPPGTVHVNRVTIGPLEFNDCTVGVSETPFAGKSDGFISTDMFASYLITLDHAAGKLVLDPLPPQPSLLPGDRSIPPGLRDYSPIYRRMQYLLVPVDLNNKTRRLFVLDSGIRLSAMANGVAHSVSTTKVNFTNPIQTVSGATLQVYRDNFDFHFANQAIDRQGHILDLEPSGISHSAGIEVAGLLGFDMLHNLTMHLDYRDGLVKFESADAGAGSSHSASLTASSARAAGGPECAPNETIDRPLNTAIQAKVTGLLDSAHTKPGREVTVTLVNGWADPECTLAAGAMLYGHVTSASGKGSGKPELSLVFDHADCDGHEKKPLTLRIIGVVAAPDAYVGLHSVLPSEVAGARDISVMAANTATFDDNLNPGGPPNTIRPGITAGMPKMKLEPLGGPECSARFTSSEQNVRIGAGAQLLLTRQSPYMATN
jgi:hypothetical protein